LRVSSEAVRDTVPRDKEARVQSLYFRGLEQFTGVLKELVRGKVTSKDDHIGSSF
jgi:hypothetical protein